jgi:hypothetical protein
MIVVTREERKTKDREVTTGEKKTKRKGYCSFELFLDATASSLKTFRITACSRTIKNVALSGNDPECKVSMRHF